MADEPSPPTNGDEAAATDWTDRASWPQDVSQQLYQVARLSAHIDALSTDLDDDYWARMDLYLELRAMDPPVPFHIIGEFASTKESAVRIGVAKELGRCEKVARESVGSEQELGRRDRGRDRIALAQAVRAREREERVARRAPRRT
jgi:hypothetical protein